jgi:hypothetical protein
MNCKKVIQPQSVCYRITKTLKKLDLIKKNTYYAFIFSLQDYDWKVKRRNKHKQKEPV